MAEARRIATDRGTSLEQLVRDFLSDLSRRQNVESVVVELKEAWGRENYRSERPWTRDELDDDKRS